MIIKKAFISLFIGKSRSCLALCLVALPFLGGCGAAFKTYEESAERLKESSTGAPLFSHANSYVSVSSPTVASGSNVTLTLTSLDSEASAFASGGKTVSFSLSGGLSDGVISSVTDHGNGVYTATLTATTAGSASDVTATVDGISLASPSPTITVSHGAVSLSESTFAISSATVPSGSVAIVTLTARDAAGNLHTSGGLNVAFSLSGGTSSGSFDPTDNFSAGIYTAGFNATVSGSSSDLEATIDGSPVTSAGPSVTVIPDTVDLGQSSVTVSSASVNSGSDITITLTARDSSGNQLSTGGLNVVFSLANGVSDGTIAAVSDNGDGTYSATFTGTTSGSASDVQATIGGNPVTSASPTITVNPGPLSLSQSTIEVSAASVNSGSDVTFTVTAKDAAGNILSAGGLSVAFALANGTSDGTIAAVSDNSDGTYSATFTGTTSGSASDVQATIGGNAVTSASPTITVNPGPLSLSQSTIEVSAASVSSGSDVTFTVTAKDAAGNILSAGGLSVAFALANGTSDGTIAAVSDNSDGTYTATFTGTTSGSASDVQATIGGNSVTSTSPTITVNPGPAAELAFHGAPSATTTAGVDLADQPVVRIYDAAGNFKTDGTNIVTLTVYSDATCDTPATGTTPVTASANPLTASGGEAAFANVKVNKAGTVYLGATTPGLTKACSAAINVDHGTPTKLEFAQSHNDSVAGAAFVSQPHVEVTDAYGNRADTGGPYEITLAPYSDSDCSTPKTGDLRYDTVAINPIDTALGIAQFTDINFTKTGTLYLGATTPGIDPVCSTGATIMHGAPVKMDFYFPPGYLPIGNCSRPFQVRLYDEFDNFANTNTFGVQSLSVSADNSAQIFSDAVCAATTAGGNSNNGIYSFYIKDNVQEAVTITVSHAGWTDLSLNLNSALIDKIYAGAVNSYTCYEIDGHTNCARGSSYLRMGPSVEKFVSGSSESGCAIISSEAYCVGSNNKGQLGNGATTPTSSSEPVKINLSGNVLDISMGWENVCAVVDGSLAGEVWCWGDAGAGRLGDPALVSGIHPPVKAISSGATSVVSSSVGTSCAIVSGGAQCWGRGSGGQIGDGNGIHQTAPTPVSGLAAGVTQISSGPHHTCAVVSGGAKCWGTNTYGQLGDGTTTDSLVPIDVPGFTSGVSAISAGNHFTCAIKDDDVHCWGLNNHGQAGLPLALGNLDYEATPYLVASGGVTHISAGNNHACAIKDGDPICWGSNASNAMNFEYSSTALGYSYYPSPINTLLSSNVTKFVPGGSSACAIMSGAAYCWGGSTSLGVIPSLDRPTPTRVSSLGTDILDISLGGAVCATHGTPGAVNLSCWGANHQGQTGVGAITTYEATPILVAELPTGNVGASPSDITHVTTGIRHTCAVIGATDIYCWGENASGQLGNGDPTTPILTPGLVDTSMFPGGYVVEKLSSVQNATCALLTSGEIYCWGDNSNGQIGVGSSAPYFDTPQFVLAGASDISGPNYMQTFCADIGGELYCWGQTSPLITIAGSSVNSPTLMAAVTGASIRNITLGQTHGCASVDGVNYCWGNNQYGKLGDGTYASATAAAVPTIVASGQIGTFRNGGCAIDAGALKCWGFLETQIPVIGELAPGSPIGPVTQGAVVVPFQ